MPKINLTDVLTTEDKQTIIDILSTVSDSPITLLNTLLTQALIVDNLTTADSTKLLSANQGVELKALIDRIDTAIVLMGVWDASLGTFPTSTNAGETWIVSVGGTVNGVEFTANDRILATADGASASIYASNWHKLDYTDAVLSVDGATGAIDLSGVYEPKDATILKDADIGTTVQAYDVDTTKNDVSNVFTAPQRATITAGANAINFTLSNNLEFTATAVNVTVGTMATKKGQEGSITIHSAENITGWGAEFLFAPDFSVVTPTPPASPLGTMEFWYKVVEVNGVDGGTANKIHVAWAS